MRTRLPLITAAALTTAAVWSATTTAQPTADPAAGLAAEHPRCESLVDPLGIGTATPRLTWTLAAPGRGVVQSAYQVMVASTPASLEAGTADLWDSGRVASNRTFQVEYKGKPLASRQACWWRVRAWDGAGRPGPWSATAKWEVGLLAASDWQAKWVSAQTPLPAGLAVAIDGATYETTEGKKVSKDVTEAVRKAVHDGALAFEVTNEMFGGDPAKDKHKQLRVRYTVNGGPVTVATFKEHERASLPPRPLPLIRRLFRVSSPVARARLYATAMGVYDLTINGRRVGDAVLAPDWTDYKKRARYQAYDVTPLVKDGDNEMVAQLANGWYAGHIGNGGYHYWGEHPALLAQLEVTHADGTVEQFGTGEKWQAHASPTLSSDFMLGENYDARAEPSTAARVGPAGWGPVRVVTEGLPPELDAQVGPPVRELMTITPKAMTEPKDGHYLFDLGQNMVGVERLKLSAPAGTVVTVRVAEMLNKDGTIYTRNYRGAPSIDTYTCRGGGVETWQPTFTFHGFRYVELTGLPAKPALDAVTGVVLGSDTPNAGDFSCSDPRLNQLQSNIRWGQRGNFVSVPTDCPQRDERLGWMGDAQVFAGTAVYNADVQAFFDKWLVDVDDAQKADGRFTNVSPDNGAGEGTPGWGDAGVIVPWTVYATYGDREELARHLPNMERWVDWCAEHSDHLVRRKATGLGSNFGDWLAIGANTPGDYLGTAYFAHVADLVARSAAAVGDDAAAAKYGKLFDDAKAAFAKEYVADDGKLKPDTQTSYAMALAFDLLPVDARPAAADRLAQRVHDNQDRLNTGFLGVSYLLPSLADHGQTPTAFALLTQDAFPSWLFSVKHGATTIWERWDGWTPEKGFQDPGMNSFNHYSLGSCGKWLYEGVAGLAPAAGAVAYDRLDVRPHVGGGLTSAAAHYDSIRGRIATDWKVDGGRLTLTVTVPPNVTATVYVPTADPAAVTESGHPLSQADGVTVGPATPGAAVVEVGSGTYTFAGPAPAVN